MGHLREVGKIVTKEKKRRGRKKDVPSINILSYHVCYIFVLNQI
jgi:hypothetical protein